MNLTLPPDKQFPEDIKVFKHKLDNCINFTVSRYGDGEWAVIKGTSIQIKGGEFSFSGDREEDKLKREKLSASFVFQHPQYYVGIPCPCCQGQNRFEQMREASQQPIERLTWANIWCNGNYGYLRTEVLPAIAKRKSVLCCNGDGAIENLPFTPEKFFPISHDAWENNWDTIETLKDYIDSDNITDHVFAIAGGPFANILCYELTKFNSNNTYIDIGSTLNPLLGTGGFFRGYFDPNSYWGRLNCIWG
jgi:hypothetical protein